MRVQSAKTNINKMEQLDNSETPLFLPVKYKVNCFGLPLTLWPRPASMRLHNEFLQ